MPGSTGSGHQPPPSRTERVAPPAAESAHERHSPLIIAEIGTGHGGDLGRARELIAAASAAGADCAKFQWVIADEILHPATGSVRLPGGSVDLYQRFRSLEQPAPFYAQLKQLCADAGISFLCTPFGPASAAGLADMGVERFKIASPELNHLPLLRQVANFGKPMILSTGVSTLADIERALSVCATVEVTLLHCITAYPAREEEYNLAVIPHMAALFGVPVGISDHSMDPILVPAVATALGAAAVEKHITLSRSDPGLDDPIALTPDDFAEMVRTVRDASQNDSSSRSGVEWAVDRYGENRVTAVMGSGKKSLAPGEAANYGRSNRSIRAVRDIAAGAVIEAPDVAVLRSEHNLEPGLPPWVLETVVGSRTTRPVADGAGISWEDLIRRA